jgi:hypothetical protein
VHPLVGVFLAIWLSFVVVGTFGFVAEVLPPKPGSDGGAAPGVGSLIFVPLAMLAFILGFAWFGRYLARDERQRLVEFLRRTLDAQEAA